MSSAAKVQHARPPNSSQHLKASAMMSTGGDRMRFSAHQREKEFVSSYAGNQKPLAPSRITEDPKSKKLGGQSRKLRVTDFELVRTLGTGTRPFLFLGLVSGALRADAEILAGTFARV